MSDTIAVIDLGSNSFHLLVAKQQNGGFQVIDSAKEMVQLAEGLQDNKSISQAACQRALDCLSRFGQRLSHLAPEQVRIVGTNTLRAAKRNSDFMNQAEALLGHSINIISGVEEARLVYLGVSHSTARDDGRQFVVDIGGGSTEIIIGEQFSPLRMESLYMGCVSMSQRFFTNGKITSRKINKASIAALLELEPHIESFKTIGWKTSIGSSGTIRTVDAIVRENSWSEDGISSEALDKVLDAICHFEEVDKINLAGLKKERIPVFIGGVIILRAVFDAFDIDKMKVSTGALREGLLYDLLGRKQHESTRFNAVDNLAKRHNVDCEHAKKVEQTVVELWAQVQHDWLLENESNEHLLRWAARLHELGLNIAHSQHHKHAAYIVKNTDLDGFSRQEQEVLAILIQLHRRGFSKMLVKELEKMKQKIILRLAVLLRIAVILHRSRKPQAVALPVCRVTGDHITLEFPQDWEQEHPLTIADLHE
ncbi:MAG: exopolyphosphatase, partial [Gammaproteobacteria bacterium]|nr:exopolyphosphatase [Gammaproteobacteria bacterium]